MKAEDLSRTQAVEDEDTGANGQDNTLGYMRTLEYDWLKPMLTNTAPAQPRSTVDQKYQTVEWQYNAARDINITNIQSVGDLGHEIEKILSEVERAAQQDIIEPDKARNITGQLREAADQASQPQPAWRTILRCIGKALELTVEVAAFVSLSTDLGLLFGMGLVLLLRSNHNASLSPSNTSPTSQSVDT